MSKKIKKLLGIDEPLIVSQKPKKIIDMIKLEREQLAKKDGVTILSTATRKGTQK